MFLVDDLIPFEYVVRLYHESFSLHSLLLAVCGVW